MSEKGKDWKDLIGIGVEENFSFQRTAKEILNSWAGGLPEKIRQKYLII
ncbi:MAG: hypothetical protein GXO21_04305 [Aquificae bacterium]|nr:hypothetical protein [Aquificota bacterium]